MQQRENLRRAILMIGVLCLALFSAQLFGNTLQHFRTVFGTDVATAGVGGLRGFGTGTIELSGVSGPVTQAYLYWHGPASSPLPTANALVTINGTSVTGQNIGLSGPNCWTPPFTVSHAYRADVTNIVSALGNGTYELTGLSSNLVAETNGASLVVFYQDGNSSNDRDIVILDGNDSTVQSVFDARGWSFSFTGISWSSGSASLGFHVSDGQPGADPALFLNGSTLAAAGTTFQGDSVPTDNFNPLGLWDVRNFAITAFLRPGLNSLSLTTSAIAPDCLSLVAALIDLPVGAAPGDRLTVDPVNSENCVGEIQTLTAHLSSSDGAPIAGQIVTFQVTSGPNAGTIRTAVTNAAGNASISYFSLLAGTDQWQVCATRNGQDVCAFAWVEWENCNQPPDVSGAAASPDCLFPPNHQFVPIEITGVTDPDGDPVTVTVIRVTSDEPTGTTVGAGGMRHSPDAIGVGTSNVSLRAERSGPGDGRVYEITFVARDSRGGATTGQVRVKVPTHREKDSCPAVDSGQRYDASE